MIIICFLAQLKLYNFLKAEEMETSAICLFLVCLICKFLLCSTSIVHIFISCAKSQEIIMFGCDLHNCPFTDMQRTLVLKKIIPSVKPTSTLGKLCRSRANDDTLD